MTVHIENHPYALFRNGVIVNIITMAEHDENLVRHIALESSADSFLSCCEYGIAQVGGDFYDGRFRDKKVYSTWVWDNASWSWVAPLPKPADTVDTVHGWDEETGRWVALNLDNPDTAPRE